MDLFGSMTIAASGMTAQDERIKVISENLANANSTALTPGGDPYRRQVVSFKDHFSKQVGADVVQVAGVSTDPSPFPLRYEPSNPAANAEGYVKLPNVNPLIEMVDLREAERSYMANMSAVDAAKTMLMQTVNMLQ